MIVSCSQGSADVFLQAIFVLVTIVDTHRVTIEHIIVGLGIGGVGITDLRAKDDFVHRVDLILHLQTHLCIPRLAEFDGRIAVDVGGLFAITLFVGECSCIVDGMIEGSVTTKKQFGFAVFFLDLASEINIGIYAQILGSRNACILSAPIATSATRTNLVGIVGTTDNRGLAFAQEQVGKDIRAIAEVVGKELIIVVKPATIIRY